MSYTESQVADVRAPSGSSAPTQADRIAHASGGEDEIATALTAGEMATIMVGSQAIRVSFSAASGNTVATTDMRLAAGSRFDWFVQGDTDDWIAAEADDAATSWEAGVWTSSGARG